jgi:topoisomerase-4 subunit A
MELEDGTRLLHYFAGTADTPLLMASTAGYGFMAKAGDMHSRQKGGKSFITLDAGDEPLMPSVIGKAASAIACLSESGRLLVFGMDEIKMQPGGGRGVIFMDLEKNEKLVAAQAISQKGVRVIGISSRAAKPQEISLSAAALAPHIGKRARKGRALATRMKASQLQAIG